jgi:hypothetical protein
VSVLPLFVDVRTQLFEVCAGQLLLEPQTLGVPLPPQV